MSSSPATLKYFLCSGRVVEYEKLHENPDKHILGHLVYLTFDGRKISALALWETPTATNVVPPVAPVTVAHLVGDANIWCRFVFDDGHVCGCHERWEIGKAAFMALMSRYGKESQE